MRPRSAASASAKRDRVSTPIASAGIGALKRRRKERPSSVARAAKARYVHLAAGARPDRVQARPKPRRIKAVNAGVDLAGPALVPLDDGPHSPVLAPARTRPKPAASDTRAVRNVSGSAAFQMGGHQSGQRRRRNQRSIGIDHENVAGTAAEDAPRLRGGVARPKRLPLLDGLHAGAEGGTDTLGTATDDGDNALDARLADGPFNVAHHGAAAQGMQRLGYLGLHPRTLARRQNHRRPVAQPPLLKTKRPRKP